MPELLKLQK